VIFTVPGELAPLALQNQHLFYALLFRAVAQTLFGIAADRRRLGARIGFLAVLHTCLLRAYGPRKFMKIRQGLR
jgi:hypothetical protein